MRPILYKQKTVTAKYKSKILEKNNKKSIEYYKT